MRIALIAVIDQSGGIGKDGSVPWRSRTDLKWFKITTMGHHLIMGRKTFESIGAPLSGRTNLILSRNPAYTPTGTFVFDSLDSALKFARDRGETEVFIIGGGEIFSQSLPLADRLYLTRLHGEFDCDVFFPPYDPQQWRLISSQSYPQSEHDQAPLTIQVFERNQ